MAKIEIVCLTAAKPYFDDEPQEVIKRGVHTYEVGSGRHTVYARAAWCGSPELLVDLRPDETVRLRLQSFKYDLASKVGLMISTLLFALTLYFPVLVLMGAFMLYQLYHVTIGRKRYLRLEVVEHSEG
ncbi:MAG: hypothetical protein CSA97_00740 [Bacteroidetes bacterium]|nr:MAG: hypothetical protein CSA97_00740 [Bacteroidota bacterium]